MKKLLFITPELPYPMQSGGKVKSMKLLHALAERYEVVPPLTVFLPVRVATEADGVLRARPCPTNGSGDFFTLAETDGFLELPPGPATCAAGLVAPFHAW